VNLLEYHHAYEGGLRWRLDSEGIELEPGLHPRTGGEPATIRRIWGEWSPHIQHWSYVCGIPAELLLATVATESRRDLDPRQDRQEPGYVSDETTPERVSVGLCHPLISTARAVTGFACGRHWLQEPRNNLMIAALVIRGDAVMTGLDPILVAAKYNAGTIRETLSNPFRLRSTGDHLSRFASWYNDAVDVMHIKGSARDHAWMLAAHAEGLL
jgi:hypothetical protein